MSASCRPNCFDLDRKGEKDITHEFLSFDFHFIKTFKKNEKKNKIESSTESPLESLASDDNWANYLVVCV